MDLHSKGEVRSFLNALLHFPLGVLIVSFHNVWHGLPVVLTLIGWGLECDGLADLHAAISVKRFGQT